VSDGKKPLRLAFHDVTMQKLRVTTKCGKRKNRDRYVLTMTSQLRRSERNEQTVDTSVGNRQRFQTGDTTGDTPKPDA